MKVLKGLILRSDTESGFVSLHILISLNDVHAEYIQRYVVNLKNKVGKSAKK